ncbi:MAG: hypothetical protein IPL97_03095 [Niastella sp.]|nr:hypothetical protein [Niastella sp.]
MKKITLLLLTTACILQTAFSQSVSINNDASVADASAILDVKSISKGMLLPHITMAQRNAIATPANGLIIYQTDNTPGFFIVTTPRRGAYWCKLITCRRHCDERNKT